MSEPSWWQRCQTLREEPNRDEWYCLESFREFASQNKISEFMESKKPLCVGHIPQHNILECLENMLKKLNINVNVTKEECEYFMCNTEKEQIETIKQFKMYVWLLLFFFFFFFCFFFFFF